MNEEEHTKKESYVVCDVLFFLWGRAVEKKKVVSMKEEKTSHQILLLLASSKHFLTGVCKKTTHVFSTHTYNIYILKKVCRKYAEGMQCKSLTLPYSQHLFGTPATKPISNQTKTARPYFTKCIKTLNTFVETFFSPDIFGLTFSFFLSFVFWKRIESFPE